MTVVLWWGSSVGCHGLLDPVKEFDDLGVDTRSFGRSAVFAPRCDASQHPAAILLANQTTPTIALEKQTKIILNINDMHKCFFNFLPNLWLQNDNTSMYNDDVIKWKHFPRYWPFVRGIHQSPVNSPHKGQWRGALMFSLICTRINGWVNNGKAGDLRRYRVRYDVTVMI